MLTLLLSSMLALTTPMANEPETTDTNTTEVAAELKAKPKKASQLVWCTYYGKSSNGRKTASGERHYSHEYVCAHLTLPFGTRIHLRNPKNGKEIVVKVNDRGPHSKKYKLDLSYGAAQALGFIRAGVCQLEMTVLDK